MRSLIKKFVPSGAFRTVEPIGHLAEAVINQTVHGFPAKGLQVIGVTGTDGKTSTSTLITQMLRHAGLKVAMMTTISIDYGDGIVHANPTRLTSVGSSELVKQLKKIKATGAEWLVLETTSHALAQHRVWGVPYSIGVMTNVGHEHLDYHRTFERYRDAKKMLFEQVDRNRKGLRIGIANADDPSGELFAAAVKNPVLYGTKKGDLLAKDVLLTPSGSTYTAVIGDEAYSITCHLPGSFNVYNSLAAVAVGWAIGLTKTQIEQGIASLDSVEGRMTRVDEGQDFDVIVDYAHTPESFEKVFKEVRPLVGLPRLSGLDALQGATEEAQQAVHSGTVSEHRRSATQQGAKNTASVSGSAREQGGETRGPGRMIVVFGSAGRRDIAKRAKQGKIAGQYCDIVIVTEEDDRDIDGQEILEQIASGAEAAGKIKDKDLFLVHDREDAIVVAVKMAQPGDMILLLGKGHEKSILSNGPKATEYRSRPQDDSDPERVVKREYDEVGVARSILKMK